MKRFPLALFVATAFLFGGLAQAAPVPWNYNWTPSTLQVNTDTSPTTSFATLTNEPGRTVNTDHTDITTTAISVTSDAPVGFPDKFVNNGDVSFNLKLTDLNSGQFANILFTGTFKTQNPLDPSEISSESANLKFTPTGIQTVTQQLGQNEYTVKFVSYTPPGPPDSTNKGSIAYHVTVRNLDIQKLQSPEPSTMLLAGLGSSLMGLRAWRKRRRHNSPQRA